jgi:sedoheptulokinase
LTNLETENFEVGMVTLGVLAGVVAELHRFFVEFPERTRTRIGRIAVTGNAIRRNPLLERIISDYFARPVVVRRHEEEAAVGAAIAAGVGIGIWPDFIEAAGVVEELG